MSQQGLGASFLPVGRQPRAARHGRAPGPHVRRALGWEVGAGWQCSRSRHPAAQQGQRLSIHKQTEQISGQRIMETRFLSVGEGRDKFAKAEAGMSPVVLDWSQRHWRELVVFDRYS